MLLAAGGAEAVALARSDRPDLILMDIRMPGMNGFDACQALADDERTDAIPVVAVTAERFDRAGRARIDELFHSLLCKPVLAARLQEHVRGIIGDP